MRKVYGFAAAALVLALAAPMGLQAQVMIAPEAAYADGVDLGVGAQLTIPLPSLNENVELAGRFNFFFPDVGDYWEINGDLHYLFTTDGDSQVTPYVLAGVGIGRWSFDADLGSFGSVSASSTEVALRAGGGLRIPASDKLNFVAEGAIGIGDIPDYAIRAGLQFTTGN
jgi:opacity protein-like surface antigen